MRTKIYLISLILGIIMATACNAPKEKSANELLEDPKMCNEIFNAILKDAGYSQNFMEKMMSTKNCSSPFLQNLTMVKMSCMSDETDTTDREIVEKMTDLMIRKMEVDSVVCDKTCAKIIENEQLRSKLMHMSKMRKNEE